MIGYDIKWKYPYGSFETNNGYDCIQLTESHEAGELINEHWLIVNCDFEGFKGVYESGLYVKIIDIRFLDIFATDINYDNRKDLKKVNTERKQYKVNGSTYTTDIRIYQYNSQV
jgi:hypothetical protein